MARPRKGAHQADTPIAGRDDQRLFVSGACNQGKPALIILLCLSSRSTVVTSLFAKSGLHTLRRGQKSGSGSSLEPDFAPFPSPWVFVAGRRRCHEEKFASR